MRSSRKRKNSSRNEPPPGRALARRTAATKKAASHAAKQLLRDKLEKLTTLERAQVFLDVIAEDVPTPGPGTSDTVLVMSMLGQRAKSLYANLLYSFGSPVEIGPILAVRPLVELAILTKWISLDPEFRAWLYVADAEAQELVHINAVRLHAADRGHPVRETSESVAVIEQKEQLRKAALAKLKELDINYGKGQIMPNLRRMTDDVIGMDPGWKLVMNDAYVYAYKTFSPWEHSDASSFKATARTSSPDDWHWLGDKSPWHPADLEGIGSMTFAMILEVVFTAIGDTENQGFARRIRDHIFLNYVRPEAVQPPTDKPEQSPEP
jgi:hypothetical protein